MMEKYVYADILLSNPREPGLVPLRAKALVDTGSNFLILPEHIAIQLKFESSPIDATREITLADGSHRTVPYVGPVSVRFGNRMCFVGALVMGDEPLLGLVPMADMDLVVYAEERRLDVNPDSPNIPSAKAK
ncbi:MAG: clan AA aspartic protease [Gallionellaceae bacterium]|nr:clan AA aspartic protease [Gallionellaceae bacterium]